MKVILNKKITIKHNTHDVFIVPAEFMINELQSKVNTVFDDVFGSTPLSQRLEDIHQQSVDLHRFRNIIDLQNATGDLLASTIMLASECGWSIDDVVKQTLQRIESRKDQYRALGRKVNVAILGGAFNPPTKAHIEVAQLILNLSKCIDEVWLMPCYGHMYDKKMSPSEMRLEMCKLAVVGDGRIKVCDFEIKHKLKGETYHTIKLLLDDPQYKDTYNFSWIIGLDNALTFDKWVNYQHLERLIQFIVVPRTNYVCNGNEWFMKSPHMYLSNNSIQKYSHLSSTMFRNTFLLDVEKAKDMLPESVFRYIEQTKLFSNDSDKH